jgi:hypothetical protein
MGEIKPKTNLDFEKLKVDSRTAGGIINLNL